MGSKIAAVIVGIVLAALIVSHAQAGEYGLVAGDLVIAVVCFVAWWQPHRRDRD